MTQFSLKTSCIAISLFLTLSCNSEPKSEPFLPEVVLEYSPKNENKEIANFFEKLHKKRNFNGNVLIAKKGKIVYEGSFGWADYMRKKKLNIDTRFQLASVSKPFTAAAILMLEERGKLKLNQTVDHFFPGFPYPNITIFYLLTHQSGLTNYVYFSERVWKDKKKPLNNPLAVDLFAKYKPGRYANEGKVFHYNNTNYMLLGAIVEKVSGESYASFMKKNIFDPCGMKNTKVLTTNNKAEYPNDLAVGHDRAWRYSVVPNYLDGTTGDKGIYSTVKDLFLFDQALRRGKVLSKEKQNMAYASHIKEHGLFGYGFGWRTFDDKKTQKTIVYHTGWWHGFKNLFVRNISDDTEIVILSNFVNGSINEIDELYEILDMPVIRKNAYD